MGVDSPASQKTFTICNCDTALDEAMDIHYVKNVNNCVLIAL